MVVKVGHRGAAGHEPENTLRGFRRAVELGADMVELDVHLCGSGELVVIHDDTVDRTTNGTGAVSELTFEELSRLDAGLGERIPTLDEVIDVADREIGVNVELKGLGTAGPVHEVIEGAISEKGWSRDGFIVSSFHLGELAAIRELSDQVRTGVLLARDRGGILEFAELNKAYSIHPYFGNVDSEFIGEARDRGLRTFVWTVNDPADIGEMKSLGVDGIISDYPDRI
ncbi:MAG: glycerophosphodiester phosphodiesterase [Candidatus Bathyarchaeota archaeon]|nr:MAG: glycerophosphodiester phosphodiesterase [Candidatus Bathyarchaeota archaeon]